MTACPDCQKLAEYSFWHGYSADRLECRARDIARVPAYFESAKAKAITEPYKAALQRAFQGDWTTWHARVKHYAGLIKKAKGKA